MKLVVEKKKQEKRVLRVIETRAVPSPTPLGLRFRNNRVLTDDPSLCSQTSRVAQRLPLIFPSSKLEPIELDKHTINLIVLINNNETNIRQPRL
jgi:hypothetical protein